jgi:hypothetical protein
VIADGDFTRDYYEELQARMRAILIAVGSFISPEQLSLFNELVDANEPGAALDMLTEALADSDTKMSQADFEDIKSVEERMKLGSGIINRVRPQAGQ